MKYIPTNRMIGGVEIRVFDPETGLPIPKDAVLDTTDMPFEKQMYFQRIFVDGDLTVYEEKQNNKKLKE